MNRAYYSRSIIDFLADDPDLILGELARCSEFAVEQAQRDAWLSQIHGLKRELVGHSGTIHLEYSIPRMGKRVDAVVVTGAAVFVIEYKVGDNRYSSHAIDQVTDYALDLKNFHETSHSCFLIPVLVATNAPDVVIKPELTPHRDRFFAPMRSNGRSLGQILQAVQAAIGDVLPIDQAAWEHGGYLPTPTIIEAATRPLQRARGVRDLS